MFTHLHVHTEYSLLDGLSSISGLVESAKDQGMTAMGITDHGGMYGVVEFYSACKAAGIKPIIGCELYVAPGSRKDRKPSEKSAFHLTVLAQNDLGYKNLMQLVTTSHLDGFYYKPRVDHQVLEEHSEGLVVLSGCPSAELSRAIIDGDTNQAIEIARWYKETFPNFYLELQRHDDLPFLDDLNRGLLNLGEKLDIPLAATNDLHYVKREDAPYQDVMVCIQTNTNLQDDKRLKMSDDSYYLKGPDEMAYLFDDLPEAIDNTQRIADMCDVTLDFSTLHLPQYDTPDGEDADAYLRKLCWTGFGERYATGSPEGAKERLEYELDVITQTQYPNYFLVVWDIAEFAHRSDILLGVRGSAASSLALYCLGVTEIDPLEYQLVFERFLNVERKEMPDIDMDFQDDRREEAIQYVLQKYGRDHVCQIITFGTMGAKAAIRDVGRAMAMSYADVDRIARLVPTRLGITIDEAMETTPEMQEAYEGDSTLRELVDTARHMEGVVRHASTHAAGVVISQDPLTEYVPLQRSAKGDEQDIATTQYAMEPVAKLGLLKMDFLGLSNLTILSMTMKLLHNERGIDIDLKEIPLDNQASYDLLASGETTGVFQLESPGMRRYIKELKPSSVRELAAMIALYRPGPMEHIGRFIESKFGRTPVSYPHPALEGILEETYGVIVYQDQVLQILRTFAGYTLGTADIVRKAMGKKIMELMAKEREKFLDGAAGLGYGAEIATQVFDLIEPFAGYAFNKAHSVSYAMVAYWTAYFKANYPVEFMTSILNSYMGNADKVIAVVGECARLGIPVLPPDVNRSQVFFSVDTDESGTPGIRFGLASVKNVGETAVEPLVAARAEDGVFVDLEDFCRRAGTGVANRRVLESLMRVGGLDSFEATGALLANLDHLVSMMQREAQLQRSGQTTMFDLFGQSVPTPLGETHLSGGVEVTPSERTAWERELLGVALSAKAQYDLSRGALADAILSPEQLESEKERTRVTVLGVVSGLRQRFDKENRRIGFATVELFGGSVEVALWAEAYERTAELWQEGAIVEVVGRVKRRDDQVTITCESASVYTPPSDESDGEEIPVPASHMEEWHEPTQDQSMNEVPTVSTATPIPAQSSANGSTPPAFAGMAPKPTPAPAQPTANGNGNGHHDYQAAGVSDKMLINLTETDKPEDDAYLLREVLQVVLEYPGNHGVDLVISSGGKRYRLEMPIITTNCSSELQDRLKTMLGRQDAVTLMASTS
ncbi:MAG: DNA polymerase III subunit alpha [Chloroflexi bacterium]|nr:DNA polymerase III subunit alpha [Chloroflexota bacterium]